MNRTLLDTIGEFFAPLILAFESKDQLSAFISDLGWKIEWNSTQEELIRELMQADQLIGNLEGIWEAYQAEGKVTEALAVEALELVGTVFDTVQHFTAAENRQRIAELPVPFSTPEDWDEILAALPGYLLVRWLQVNVPIVYELLYFTGIIDEEPRIGQPPRPVMDWASLGQLFSEPDDMIKGRFGWGGDFDGDAFVAALARLLRAFELDAFVARAEGVIGDVQNALEQELRLPLVPRNLVPKVGGFQAEVKLAMLAGEGTIIPRGIGGSLSARGPSDIPVPLAEGWNLVLASPVLDPGELATFELTQQGLQVAALPPQLGVDVAVEGVPPDPEKPWRLFGGDTGARLETSEFGVGFGISAGTPPDIRLFGNTAIKLVIAPGDGDSFVAEILGDQQMEVDASIAVRWSSVDGFAFEGGVGFDVAIPVDLKLGPIFLTQIRIGMAGGAEGLTIEGAVSGGLDVAVLAVAVEDLGLRATVVPVAEGERGLLGPVDIKLGFKPPKGIGMVIDAGGVVTGGGYLYHDESLAEYGGVAEIGFLSLKLSAIGMLTTRMPDGEDGWSLFLAVFSEFPPIQLAFGFTLNGVGGLVGLHRTFDDEALRERLLAGALDSIMFPQDPVANAPQILSDIRAVFPPSKGQFVFGVMLKLGWGTPSIVSLELGVIVELPDPIKIALLGQLGMILPKPDATLVEINMDMFGVANLTEGTLAMDATIRDSHIMHLLTLSGDMAFRAEFGDRPNMLMSIGGFHPDFEPPASAPNLRRMKAALPLGKYAAVELSGYVAVTSNSFQTGGRIDIWVKVAGLSAEGWFGFDALIQFSPFGFKFTTEIGFSVSFKSITLLGVDVWLQIVGPAPWELDGYAKVKICGFKKKLTVDLELGRKTAVAVPSYDVMDMLVKALEDPESWSVGEGAGTPLVVYAKKADGTSALDPRGNLSFRQKVVPLNKAIGKFGNGTVIGTDLFTVEDLEAGGTSLSPDYLDDWFAPAEFEELTDEQKLARPSFQEMDGGASFGGNPPEMGGAFDGEEGYEDIVLDPADNRRSKAGGVEKPEGRTVVTSAQSLKSEGPAPRPMRLRKQVFEPARSIPVRTMEKYKGGASRSGAVKTITSAAVKDGTIMRAKSAGRRRFQ